MFFFFNKFFFDFFIDILDMNVFSLFVFYLLNIVIIGSKAYAHILKVTLKNMFF
jgi:hypothetical protein